MPGLRSPLAVTTFDAADTQSPGAPSISATQTSNAAATVTIAPPTTDADGSPLTGLVSVTVGVALANDDGTSPFTDSASFDAVASGITTVNVNPDGSNLTATVPVLALGRTHYVAAYATD